MKQITETQIETIKSLLRKRNSHKEIKEMLDKLPEADNTKDKLRKLITERGRSKDNISIEELNNLIGDY